MLNIKHKVMNVYGVVNDAGIHTDVSKTERGAKNFATRNGYNTISIRYNCGYNVSIISEKKGNKWITVKN